jgi:hypothetical protein
MFSARFALTLTCALAALAVAGCGGGTVPSFSSATLGAPQSHRAIAPDFKKPALITLNSQSGQLEYWPIVPGGSYTPQTLSGPLGVYAGYGMAANGNVVIVANYSPAEVVTYDVKTKAENTLPDPFGKPFDVAVDKSGTIYAMDKAYVAVYKAGSSQPSRLSCPQLLNENIAVAVDNETNVYVDGYGPRFNGVVEFRKGSQTCRSLHLRSVRGYIGGVGVNPNTDALIVVDNPNLCAGGLEGRMIIYPKPYLERNSRRRNLNASYCAGTFRLSSDSSIIFVSDSTVSAGYPLIDQRSYPSAKNEGTYGAGQFGSSFYFGGFTTIPNTLPN